MKKLILSLLCFAFVGMAYSQRVIKLDEMMYDPPSLEIDESINSLTFQVTEEYTGQFYANPLRYAKENFKIMDFIEANRDKDFNGYEVTFKTNKGFLKVNYNQLGDITSSSQSFKDVRLPYKSMMSILKANKGYHLIGTKYLAYSNSGLDLDKEIYKAKLKNGKKSKMVKVNIDRDASGVAVATIE
ncbi:hypothetical protein LB467_06250 [Salegentibacter sp. JZCK2]|uniref:hypothetical protein n=1 Tax=Salegentibacter tibetensis TaxID=2873600 RepID=UPI001CCE3062|nr:hypothetical protein [Salegentibacter tibetensis]MBZ9729283.1 hypothetical protein [Salegentibacter tibetensis]